MAKVLPGDILSNSAQVLSKTSCFLLVIINFAPNLSKYSAIDFPKPVPPPVTNTTLLLKVLSGNIPVLYIFYDSPFIIYLLV